MTSRVREVLKERALAHTSNKKIVGEALLLLKDLHTHRCTINYLMDMKEAQEIINEAIQSLSEL